MADHQRDLPVAKRLCHALIDAQHRMPHAVSAIPFLYAEQREIWKAAKKAVQIHPHDADDLAACAGGHPKLAAPDCRCEHALQPSWLRKIAFMKRTVIKHGGTRLQMRGSCARYSDVHPFLPPCAVTSSHGAHKMCNSAYGICGNFSCERFLEGTPQRVSTARTHLVIFDYYCIF